MILPTEIIYNIFCYSSNIDITKTFSFVNKYWNKICQDEIFWKIKFNSDGYNDKIFKVNTFYIPYYIKYMVNKKTIQLHVKNIFNNRKDALKEIRDYIFNEYNYTLYDDYIFYDDITKEEIQNLNIQDLCEAINNSNIAIIYKTHPTKSTDSNEDENLEDYYSDSEECNYIYSETSDNSDGESENDSINNAKFIPSLTNEELYDCGTFDDSFHHRFGFIKYKLDFGSYKSFLLKKYCIPYISTHNLNTGYINILVNEMCYESPDFKCKCLTKELNKENKKIEYIERKNKKIINSIHNENLFLVKSEINKKNNTIGFMEINFKNIIV